MSRVVFKRSYRIDEIADEWRVSRRTIERAIERGEIPAFRIGRTVRILRDSVESIEQKKRPCTTPDDTRDRA